MTTITDKFNRPMRDLRVSVTDRCNFRCPYCMPAEIYGSKYQFLARPELLTFDEIVRLVGIFVELGVTKVRLTGGEPLVRANLEMLVSFLSNIPGIKDLTLTTNGYLLENMAQSLKNAGLQRVTVSLDSLDEDVFSRMSGRGYSVERVLKGIHRAQEVNLHPIKINCVVQKGVNDHTIVDLARFCKSRGYIARFIEYMDVGTINGWKMEQVVSADEIAHIIDQEMPLEPILESYPGKVAQRYRYRYEEGEIGIIASVTKPFCGACTRARLSTDGKLYTCLFAGSGRDLRDPLRSGASDTELRDLVASIWAFRVDRYSEERSDLAQAGVERKKIEMYQIGG